MTRITLDDTRRCAGGRSRIRPVAVRRDCFDCARYVGVYNDPGQDAIDPLGAWVDATAHAPGYCAERRSAGTVHADKCAAQHEAGATARDRGDALLGAAQTGAES